MRFEWDPEKSDRNFRDRGFDFGAASQIFAGRTLERADTRRDYGEPRVIAIAVVVGVVLTVVFTDRIARGGETVRRIISARRSNRYERQQYQAIATPKE